LTIREIVSSQSPRILAGLSGLTLLALLVLLRAPRDSLLTLATVLLFSLPGLFVGRALFGPITPKRPEGLILGTVFGLTSSEFVVLMSGYVAGWAVPRLLAGYSLFVVATFLATRSKWKKPVFERLREWEPGDYSILSGMIFVLLVFVAIPFLNFGKLTGRGFAYTWLFGFDFILRGSYVAAIALGLPPDFLHLAGVQFRYYLVSYAGPAFAYSLGQKTGSLLSVLLIYTLLVNIVFVATLFTLLRHFISDRRSLGWTAFVAMMAYSYYSWYVVARRLFQSLPISWGDPALAAAQLRYGDVSHLFQRLFLVEPQATTGLCLIVSILLVLEILNYEVRRYDVAVLIGAGLGIELGIDALLGLILAVWFGLTFLLRWFRTRRVLTSEFGPVAVAVVLCSLTFLGYFAVGMYSASDRGQMVLEPYGWILAFFPIYFLIEFGPMLILGLWGIGKMWKRDAARISAPLVLFALLILAQVVFVRVGVLPRERLGERLLPIVLLIWTGYFFENLFSAPRSRRTIVLAGLLLLAAVPTFFTDIYFSSDVDSPERTGYVTVADMQACRWIRRNVPEKSIVQSEPNYYGYDDARFEQVNAISLIPDFAERREILGEWYVAGTTILHTKQMEAARAHDVTKLFSASGIDGIVRVVSLYGIDYLYVGPCEQRTYPRILSILESAPNLFQEVYSQNGVHIFKRDFARPLDSR
jgi:hypothetical protein